nr:Purine catabolism regulatory protein-like family [uncultured bacterium]
MSVKSRPAFSQEIIDYCNEIQLPLFSTSWDTPFIDIMRIFSEILLKNEHRETSLAAALKNAIYYPENEDSYLNPLESNGFFRDMNYTVLMISCHTYDSDSGNSYLEQLEKKIRYFMSKGIVYEEGKHLIVLFAGESVNDISQKLYDVCQNNSDVYVGIGTTVSQLTDIHRSYETFLPAVPDESALCLSYNHWHS